jgi:hypothetical protein
LIKSTASCTFPEFFTWLSGCLVFLFRFRLVADLGQLLESIL